MDRQQLVSFILRLGIAFSFIYSAVAAFFRPDDWIVYFPSILRAYLSDGFLLSSLGLFQIVVAIWIVYGRRIFIPSVLSLLLLSLLIVSNLGTFDTTYRDITIASGALALCVLHFPRHNGYRRTS